MVWRSTAAALLIAGALVVGGSACTTGPEARPDASRASAKRPNIVFILTDDLSWNLIDKRFAPDLVRLQRKGVTFTKYFVADS